jgi:hypothetical protein
MSDDIGGYSLTLDSIQKLREDHNLLESMVFSAIGRRFMSRPFASPAKKELEPFIHGFQFFGFGNPVLIWRIIERKLDVDPYGKPIMTPALYYGNAGGLRTSTVNYVKALAINGEHVVCWVEPACI